MPIFINLPEVKSEFHNMSGDAEDLAAMLDAQLEEYVNNLESKPYKDGWSEDNWEEVSNLVTLKFINSEFATKHEIDI